jgi:protein involved in polysaccharide export with SLBB domain
VSYAFRNGVPGLCAALVLIATTQTGCMLHSAAQAVPVSSLDSSIVQSHKTQTMPLNLALLQQDKPTEHLVGAKDVLNVYIRGVLPAGNTATTTQNVLASPSSSTDYYPAHGNTQTPAFGVPVTVSDDSSVTLPFVGRVFAGGMSIPELVDEIAARYVAEGIIEPDREQITVTLARSRLQRILVIREDSDGQFAQTLAKSNVPYAKRGRAQVVDLPAFENDVLHALAATGGLPGIDAANEVWILRGNNPHSREVQAHMELGADSAIQAVSHLQESGLATRIPLRMQPYEQVPFSKRDIVLAEGDVVFVPSRDEYFYTAGLLQGGRVPIPRDHQIDVLEAIALAGGSIGGPGGSDGTQMFRGGGGGNIIPPSVAVIIRTLPDETQVPIKVNLATAIKEPSERVLIQPNDIVYLQYRAGELAGNVLLNLFNLSFLLSGAAI